LFPYTTLFRSFRAIGRDDLVGDDDFSDPQRRLARAGEVDAVVAEWVASKTLAEAMAVFEREEVAAAPVYDIEDLLADEQLAHREVFVDVPDRELDRMKVQAPVPRFSAAPPRLDHLGPRLGEHDAEVYGELRALTPTDIDALHARGVLGPKDDMTHLLRRSELALPACNDHRFAKAVSCGADLVFLDLEDAVPAGAKEESRAKAIKALTELDWGRTARAVWIK